MISCSPSSSGFFLPCGWIPGFCPGMAPASTANKRGMQARSSPKSLGPRFGGFVTLVLGQSRNGGHNRRRLTGWGSRMSLFGFQSPRFFLLQESPTPREQEMREKSKSKSVGRGRKRTRTTSAPTIAVCSHCAIEGHRVTTATVDQHVYDVAILEGVETRGSGEHPGLFGRAGHHAMRGQFRYL